MKIAIGNDHRGYTHKVALTLLLERGGHEVLDKGCDDCASADYPDHALAVGEAVAAGGADLGVLICGSGIGVSIVANKVPGVRAALCCNDEMAATTRRHNDSNVICFSGDQTPIADAERMLGLWLASSFEGGRHARRVDKILAFEQRNEDGGAGA